MLESFKLKIDNKKVFKNRDLLTFDLKNKTHPYNEIRMGKNCYEKEKLPLISISDNSKIVFFI